MEKKLKLNLKVPTILLSLLSLVFSVLGCISYFCRYLWYYNDGNSFYDYPIFIFPDIIDLFHILITVAPCILLVVYLLKFHNNFKAAIIVPIIFGLIAIKPIVFFQIYSTIDLIIDGSFIITFILATISALKGFSKKVFLIIAIMIGLISEIIPFLFDSYAISWYLENEMYIYLVAFIFRALGAITLYVTLLLFGLKNRIPAIKYTPKKKAKQTTPEQALKLLIKELELGVITEEEYQAQRAEIISKL